MNYVVHEQYEKLNKIEQLNKMNIKLSVVLANTH